MKRRTLYILEKHNGHFNNYLEVEMIRVSISWKIIAKNTFWGRTASINFHIVQVTEK